MSLPDPDEVLEMLTRFALHSAALLLTASAIPTQTVLTITTPLSLYYGQVVDGFAQAQASDNARSLATSPSTTASSTSAPSPSPPPSSPHLYWQRLRRRHPLAHCRLLRRRHPLRLHLQHRQRHHRSRHRHSDPHHLAQPRAARPARHLHRDLYRKLRHSHRPRHLLRRRHTSRHRDPQQLRNSLTHTLKPHRRHPPHHRRLHCHAKKNFTAASATVVQPGHHPGRDSSPTRRHRPLPLPPRLRDSPPARQPRHRRTDHHLHRTCLPNLSQSATTVPTGSVCTFLDGATPLGTVHPQRLRHCLTHAFDPLAPGIHAISAIWTCHAKTSPPAVPASARSSPPDPCLRPRTSARRRNDRDRPLLQRRPCRRRTKPSSSPRTQVAEPLAAGHCSHRLRHLFRWQRQPRGRYSRQLRHRQLRRLRPRPGSPRYHCRATPAARRTTRPALHQHSPRSSTLPQ